MIFALTTLGLRSASGWLGTAKVESVRFDDDDHPAWSNRRMDVGPSRVEPMVRINPGLLS